MGNEASFLTTEQIEEISSQTPFKSKDVEKLLKRYSHYDSSEKGINGIPYNTCGSMPEFSGNKFAPHLLQHYMDKNSQKIYPKQFLLICGALSPETSALKKKELLFDIFDTGKSGVMTHEEMFSLYKILFGSAISDHIILDLTLRALNHPDLDKLGEIRKDEFLKMIPDIEIKTKFSVDLQII